ncbi:6-phosphofructo-2-kinase [Saitoella coloradoensis]
MQAGESSCKSRDIQREEEADQVTELARSPPSLGKADEIRSLLRKTSLSRHIKVPSAGAGMRAASDTPWETPSSSRPSSPRNGGVPNPFNTGEQQVQPQRTQATTLDIPGLTKSKVSPYGHISDRDVGSKLVIVMVGLPARGKSYIVKKLARYMNWLQHDTRIFNVGNRRRINRDGPTDDKDVPPSPGIKPQEKKKTEHDAQFFDPQNASARALREQLAMDTLEELIHWVVYEGGTVGILDATNSTRERRQTILDRIHQVSDLKALFIESICTDRNVLEANMKLKLSGPDYKDRDPVAALDDFRKRVIMYERAYETIGDYEEEVLNLQYCKMINVGKKLVAHNIQGFLASQAIAYLMNFNLAARQIWITRHGESEDNVAGKIGGNAKLTARGHKYATALAKFIDHMRLKFREQQLEYWAKDKEKRISGLQPGVESPIRDEAPPKELAYSVWTSYLNRSIQTGEHFDDSIFAIKSIRLLDEINAGQCEGMTYDAIKEQYPHEFEARRRDKLHYRYPGPGGESYLDVIHRLNNVIVEIERMRDHVCLIGHRVIVRILLAYFLNLEQSKIIDLEVPLETLYVLEPKPYAVVSRKFVYNDQTDWFDEVEIKPGEV